MRNNEIVIVGAARTAIGRFQGTLVQIPAPQLGGVAIAAAIQRAGIDPNLIDEVIMGNVVSAGVGQAPGRQAAIKGGVPPTVGATTINKVCGSGLKAVMMAAQAIKADDAQIIVAGGMESMNGAPYLLPHARFGQRLGHGKLIDGLIHDGLWCPFEDQHMGNSAEWIAREYNISREEQDRFALRSHQRALRAIAEGKFKAEIVPVEVPQRKGPPISFDTDEGPRSDTSLEALARLKPAFQEGGTVTAGNAPGICDGAAALVVTSGTKAKELGIEPLARITGYAQAGVEPLKLFTAPIFAVRRLMDLTGFSLEDFDLIEINEAFSAQALADGKELGFDWEKVNVNGGAVALGHPIGASGARILVTLLYAMRDRGATTGLATLCLGGGEAVAMSVELV
ncbi:MAG: acetyl-CoA C-acetyltransferase [Anaerolineae bacterium]